MDLDIGQIIENYRVIERIGEGGMGVVYRAEHVAIGKLAAIKVLRSAYCENQEFVNRFLKEAVAASSIQHPGIVAIHNYGYYQHRNAYIMMEYLDGETLSARIERHIILPVDMALAITSQIASALAAAHAQNIIHRDLKPDNIMMVSDPDITGGERIKLLDFGVAKLALTDDSASKTRTGLVLGTPSYMAPEQCSGTDFVDGRSDLYSLGCILYKMVCGQPPFPTGTAAEVIARHLHVEPPRPRSVNPALPESVEALIGKLLQKQPGDRFASASDLLYSMKSMLPESNALRGFPGTSSIVKTLPYSKPMMMMMPPRPSSPDMAVELSMSMTMDIGDDDEATVVTGRPLSVPPPPPPRPSSPPQRPSSPPQRPSSPPPRPSWPSLAHPAPQVPPARELAAGALMQPERSSTISHASMALPNPSSDGSSRRGRYAISAAVALVLLVASIAILARSGNGNRTSAAQNAHAGQNANSQEPGDQEPGDQKPGDQKPGDQKPGDQEPGVQNTDNQLADSAPATAAEHQPDEDEARRRVTIELDSSPRGASVVRSSDQEVLGETPLLLELAREHDGVLELVLRASGYRDQAIRVPLAESTSRTVELDQMPVERTRSRRSDRNKRRAAGPGNPYQ